MTYYVAKDSSHLHDIVAGAVFQSKDGQRCRPNWDTSDPALYYKQFNFPMGLVYFEPHDPWCCGTFKEINLDVAVKEEIQRCESQVRKFTNMKKDLEKMLDK